VLRFSVCDSLDPPIGVSLLLLQDGTVVDPVITAAKMASRAQRNLDGKGLGKVVVVVVVVPLAFVGEVDHLRHRAVGGIGFRRCVGRMVVVVDRGLFVVVAEVPLLLRLSANHP